MSTNGGFFDGSSWRYRLYFPTIARLPYAAAYRLTDLYGSLQADRLRAERAEIGRQMQRALPELDPESVRKQTAVFYRLASRDIVDTWLIPRLQAGARAEDLVTAEGLDRLVQARADGRRVLLTGAHFGRFWMAGLPLVEQGLSVGTMTRDRPDENVHGLSKAEFRYRSFKLRVLAEALRGPFLVEGESLKALYSALDAQAMAMIFDVPYEESRQRAVQVPFLGRPAHFPTGVARVARKAGALIFPYFMREDGYRLVAQFLPPIDPEPLSDEEIISRLVALLEQRIRAEPGQWWLWQALPLFWR
ncbi:MAG: lysophospholipid acyltransferase family protein [Pseudomonadota bacterium]|nr:lysophospholipid acyltransferase family protein [Pseudomonadota bacterium]